MKELGKHFFVVNKLDNSGEQISIETKFFDNGDGVFTNQSIALQSYCNSASINLTYSLTPEILRELADELEQKRNEIINKGR